MPVMSTIKKANQEREGTDADTQIVALTMDWMTLFQNKTIKHSGEGLSLLESLLFCVFL